MTRTEIILIVLGVTALAAILLAARSGGPRVTQIDIRRACGLAHLSRTAWYRRPSEARQQTVLRLRIRELGRRAKDLVFPYRSA